MKTAVLPPAVGGVVSAGLLVALIAGAAATAALLHQAKPEPTAPQLRIPEKAPPRLVTLPTRRD